jgi:hypothetical protein
MECDYGLNRILPQETARMKGKSEVLLANPVESRSRAIDHVDIPMRNARCSMKIENEDIAKEKGGKIRRRNSGRAMNRSYWVRVTI